MDNTALENHLWLLLGAGVLPLWLLAGLCDYITHARTRIAETSGVRESFLHLLQTAEIGVPVLAVLLLEVNALVLALAGLGVVAHTITAYVDVRYAQPRRHVSVFEQFVHAFLIVLPFIALALVAILHPAQLASLWRGDASWTLEWKQGPWDIGVIASVLAGSLLFGVLPGVYEFTRTWQARARADAAE